MPNHHTVVTQQYDPRASAYLASAVHASGADLDLLATRLGEQPDAIALDMGCGGGHLSFRLAPHVKQVIACDLSATMLTTVAEEAIRRGLTNLTTQQSAAESLGYPDAAFDIVASRYSTHHWRDLPAGLAQMHRTLKARGLALFMDVIAPEDPLLDTWLQSLELLRDPSHVRNASLTQWQALLATAGFAIESTTRLRLRLDYTSWVERMQTSAPHRAAIRSLQQQASSEVQGYFEIEADGSFTLDTALIIAHKA